MTDVKYHRRGVVRQEAGRLQYQRAKDTIWATSGASSLGYTGCGHWLCSVSWYITSGHGHSSPLSVITERVHSSDQYPSPRPPPLCPDRASNMLSPLHAILHPLLILPHARPVSMQPSIITAHGYSKSPSRFVGKIHSKVTEEYEE